MAEPLLSIVTVTYNDPKGLSETIESLRPLAAPARGGLTWEHLVIDSSPAVNAPVLGPITGTDWPLRHLKTPPQGIYPALNSGIESANGRHLWFLNGGDLLRSREGLQRALAEFERSPAPDIVASAVELRRDGRFMYLHRPHASVYRSLIGLNRLCHQGLLYRRRVFSEVGPYSIELRLAADYEHHLRCAVAGMRTVAIPDNVLAVYDMSGRSNDHQATFKEFEEVQRRLARSLPLSVNVANELVRPLEHARVALLKRAAASPLAGVLRPLWLGFKRLR